MEDLEAMVLGFLSGAGFDAEVAKKAHAVDGKAEKPEPTLTRRLVPAILPTGIGAAPLPASMDNRDPLPSALGSLTYHDIYFLDDTLCKQTLPSTITKTYSILVLRRGGCSFNEKLANIPALAPEAGRLELVIILSHPDDTTQEQLIRPLLDTIQRTPSGLERRHPVAMCMVDGSEETVEALRRVARKVGAFDGKGRLAEELGAGAESGAGLAVKRRYWFESLGIPIGNLIML